MANQSIYSAFERMWAHVLAKVGGKADLEHTHDEYITSDVAHTTFLTKDEAFDGEIDLSGYATTLQLDEAINEVNQSLENKSDSGHDHGTMYCTRTEIDAEVDSVTTVAKKYTDEKTSGLVSESTFSNTVDLINEELDNHTHDIADVSGLQNALNEKAPVEHGVHVEYSSTAPIMDGTASTGTANTVARSDHQHPTDTSRASVTALDQLAETVGKKADTSSLTSHTGNKSNPHGVTCAQIGAQPAGSYAAASHGNHVPTTQTANNAVFLRNDNIWATVTPANIGAAESSHGTHVSYGTSATAVGSTVSAGSATTVSRSDHTHSLSKSAVTTALGYTPPTTDTNTTYTVASGDSNGQIKVTPSSGSAYNVSVKGLGSAAYTASTAYAASGHTHDDRYYTETEINTKLNNMVDLTTNQTVSGIKTFANGIKLGEFASLSYDSSAGAVVITFVEESE